MERVLGPMLVHTIKDAEKYSFTTVAGGKGAPGADAATHFHKQPFDDVGGAQTFPVSGGTGKERQ